jgi:hypothetical protein
LYEIDRSLPPVTQNEALAILDKFLRAEAGQLRAGVQLYVLHWDVLSAQYATLRERFSVLRELATAGYLQQAEQGVIHEESGLRWPLAVTEKAVEQIRVARRRARLPFLTRIEEWLADTRAAFPNVVGALLWLITGGVIVKVLDWLF